MLHINNTVKAQIFPNTKFSESIENQNFPIFVFPNSRSTMCAANLPQKLPGFYFPDWYYSGKFAKIKTSGKFVPLQYIVINRNVCIDR